MASTRAFLTEQFDPPLQIDDVPENAGRFIVPGAAIQRWLDGRKAGLKTKRRAKSFKGGRKYMLWTMQARNRQLPAQGGLAEWWNSGNMGNSGGVPGQQE